MSPRKSVFAPVKNALSSVSSMKWDELIGRAKAQSRVIPPNPFEPYKPAPGVLPSGSGIAMDEACGAAISWAGEAYGGFGLGNFEGLAFLGFPYLSELAQRPEYRRISEVVATEMTRKWIKIAASGNKAKTDKVKKLEAAMSRYHVREVFKEAAEQDGFFGRSHIFCDFGTEDTNELQTSVGDGRDKATKVKVEKGSLKGLRTVEAVWCYPSAVNASNPLAADWYKPQSWFVQGKLVHGSRFLTLIGREVPDMLKPAYAYGGLSMSQMAKPYVDNWLRTRQSVADLIASFSVSGIKINMADALSLDSGDALFKRVAFFNAMRSNNSTMVLNKATAADPAEEFFNVSTPLGTLDKLQAQSQEQICSVSGLPLIKYTGITPSGLNASSEHEIQVFEEWIHAYQEALFRKPLDRVFAFVQISEFGEVDPDLTYSFEPLRILDEKERAEVKKVDADTDAIYLQEGVLQPEEVRERIANDEDSSYPGLDLNVELTPPDPSEMGSIPGLNSDPLSREAA